MKRFLCYLLGHVPGALLYRYSHDGDPQSPASRGATVFVVVGFECSRCDRKVVR